MDSHSLGFEGITISLHFKKEFATKTMILKSHIVVILLLGSLILLESVSARAGRFKRDDIPDWLGGKYCLIFKPSLYKSKTDYS